MYVCCTDAAKWISEVEEAIKNLREEQASVHSRRAEERERRGGSLRSRVASTGGEQAAAVHGLIKQSLNDLKSLKGHDSIHYTTGSHPLSGHHSHQPGSAAAIAAAVGTSAAAGLVPSESLLQIVASVQNPPTPGSAGSGGGSAIGDRTPPATSKKHRRSITSGALSPV